MGMGMRSWVWVWGGCDRSMYLLQSYLKTASLIAKGVREVVFLGGVKEGGFWKEVAYVYRRNIGVAFQLSRCCGSFPVNIIHTAIF